ncbi:calcium/manganese antiporter SLC30A10 isoform X3 [Hyla sarda]|uniref:calcium/manganese antiporter SLC30A10 isoform X3 n=1 Tax=Hyla sarda TaxID=327740 RepID=UPI0024C295F2|nr:calcium/manganese antiporter SLC30A10 isoform X3 [Hyla sarda]
MLHRKFKEQQNHSRFFRSRGEPEHPHKKPTRRGGRRRNRKNKITKPPPPETRKQQEPGSQEKDINRTVIYLKMKHQREDITCSVYIICDYIDEQDSDLEEEKDQSGKNAAALNIRGVLLHVMGDALGSVVVVVAAVIFYIKPLAPDAPCNWQCYIDPSLTVVMVAIILFSAFPLIKETATILLQMVPKDINVGEIGDKISMVPGVKSIHEIHVWELASGKNIATLHVKFQNLQDYILANRNIRKIFHSQGIHAVTLQAEFTDAKDFSLECNAPCISKKCDEYLCCSQELVPFAETDGKALKKGKSSQVWYRSNDTNTDVEIPIDSNEGIPEVKVVANGLHSENQALNDKVTRL